MFVVTIVLCDRLSGNVGIAKSEFFDVLELRVGVELSCHHRCHQPRSHLLTLIVFFIGTVEWRNDRMAEWQNGLVAHVGDMSLTCRGHMTMSTKFGRHGNVLMLT